MNEELRGAFEQHCREHLLDERAVVEAWLLRFLGATEEDRQKTAKQYADWLAERTQPSSKPVAAKKRKGN